jgi:hypothetical protein
MLTIEKSLADYDKFVKPLMPLDSSRIAYY